ncbi:MAG TPA: DUF72 domain-containing protein [Sphingomicrobium sp.]|nr:DUF72 domain-containing protein [Sphingomicrobium sp.]
MSMATKVGTAGWTIPRDVAGVFPDKGSSLERYSACLPVVEINSSFYRSHRASTWERWRHSVPASFRFSVKVPKAITHEAKLCNCSELLGTFLGETKVLGDKLAVLLVQLPPKLSLDVEHAELFFKELKARTRVKIACEPRNASWFTAEADALLREHEVARVAADPAICELGADPGGWRGLNYWRLHGSPVLYRSPYAARIPKIAERIANLAEKTTDAWVIFDNTASSAAMSDALALIETLHGSPSKS